jgi:hypothetical protein
MIKYYVFPLTPKDTITSSFLYRLEDGKLERLSDRDEGWVSESHTGYVEHLEEIDTNILAEKCCQLPKDPYANCILSELKIVFYKELLLDEL